MAEGFPELNDLEIEVLRILNGEDIPGWVWGAAMATCCEALVAYGYAKGTYRITYTGREYLRRNGF